MAKVKLKKSEGKPKKVNKSIEENRDAPEPVTEDTPAGVVVDPDEANYHGDEDAEQLWYVTLQEPGRGATLGAIVRGESKADADAAFRELNGIVATEHPIRAAKVDSDHGYNVDKNGVVILTREKPKRRRSHDEDED